MGMHGDKEFKKWVIVPQCENGIGFFIPSIIPIVHSSDKHLGFFLEWQYNSFTSLMIKKNSHVIKCMNFNTVYCKNVQVFLVRNTVPVIISVALLCYIPISNIELYFQADIHS